MSMIIASDLHGTLTTGSPMLSFASWVEKYQSSLQPKIFKYKVLFSYLQVKFGLTDLHIWADKTMRDVLTLIRDPDQSQIDSIMAYIVGNELWPKRREKAISLLREYHNNGAEIIIVSAAFEPAVKLFAKKINKERVSGIGTPLVLTRDGLKLAESLTVKEIKLQRIKKLIGSRQLDIALGDTASDIPLLEQSREPIAVYPDQKLRSVAESRSWKILD